MTGQENVYSLKAKIIKSKKKCSSVSELKSTPDKQLLRPGERISISVRLCMRTTIAWYLHGLQEEDGSSITNQMFLCFKVFAYWVNIKDDVLVSEFPI